MSPYIIAGIIFLLTVAASAGVTFAYRAGRNSARVRSEQQDASDATQSAEASQQMLDARTNGIRSDNALLTTLDKGDF